MPRCSIHPYAPACECEYLSDPEEPEYQTEQDQPEQEPVYQNTDPNILDTMTGPDGTRYDVYGYPVG